LSRAEDELVAAIRARVTSSLPQVILGVGDDCAVTRAGANARLCTTDMLVEGVHFRLADLDAEQLGHKALAVNLSDIAAMGGWPLEAYVSLALPRQLAVEGFIDELYRGISTLAAQHRLAVLGGDTTHSPGPLVISVTVIGEAAADRLLLRSAARAGDRLFVSGALGDSSAGLHALKQGHADPLARWLIARHVAPRPRLDCGRALAANGRAHAAMDLSDGLSSDLPRLVEASGVSATVNAEQLPLSEPLRRYCAREGLSALELALHGGEDYELLISGEAGLDRLVEGLVEIGEVSERGGATEVLLSEGGIERRLEAAGWDPFEAAPSGD
jgi:thiamine-monophosphate kinase